MVVELPAGYDRANRNETLQTVNIIIIIIIIVTDTCSRIQQPWNRSPVVISNVSKSIQTGTFQSNIFRKTHIERGEQHKLCLLHAAVCALTWYRIKTCPYRFVGSGTAVKHCVTTWARGNTASVPLIYLCVIYIKCILKLITTLLPLRLLLAINC